MMTALKGFVGRWVLGVAGFVLVTGPVWAADPATSDGELSELLAEQLYCSVGDFFSGNIGLLIGLLMVFAGIWAMVRGAKPMAAVPIIIMGSLITALPSIAEASFKGLGNLLVGANIAQTGFVPPDCNGLEAKISAAAAKEANIRKTQSYGATFYPSQGDRRDYSCTGGYMDCQ